MRGVLLGCLMLLFARPAGAAGVDATSASFYMPGCRAALSASIPTDEIFLAGLCSGSVSAVAWMAERVELMCVPPAVVNDELTRVVVRYIDARPARMHEPFLDLTLEALAAAWPCATPSPRAAR